MKKLYLLLAAPSFVAPDYGLLKFLVAHGLNLQLPVEPLFANSISTFSPSIW